MEAPLFVKIEKYKELTEVLGRVDAKLREAKTQLSTLERLKAEEDAKIESWQQSLQELEERSKELHDALFQ